MIQTFAYGDGLEGDLYLPENVNASTEKFLLIHGGGWSHMKRNSMRNVAELFKNENCAVFNIDYRLAPEFPWPACGNDCLAAANFFLQMKIDGMENKPILICGASAGGHLALMTGLRLPRRDVAGIISISGICDPSEDRIANPERYAKLFAGKQFDEDAFPGKYLTPSAPPILVTHQYDDTVVPVNSSIAFARKAADMGCQIDSYFYDMERAGQGHAIWKVDPPRRELYDDIADACLRFLRKLCHRPEPLKNRHGMKYLGRLRHVCSSEVKESILSIGFECLDREMFDPESCYDRLAASGMKYARVQTGWSKCETVKGKYDFTWLDSIVDNLRKRGIQPWFNVGFGNTLYMTNTNGFASVGFVPLYYGTECRNAWLAYCRALAEHYRTRITHYEIWNETNLAQFWQPKGVSHEDYAELLDITQHAIREVLPDAKIGGCIGGGPRTYLMNLADTGILAKLNFFSLHPYTTAPEFEWRQTVAAYRRKFDANGGAHVEIWQGEAGFASWCPKEYWQKRFVRESEKAQAVWLLRRYAMDLSLGIPISSFFQMADMMKKAYSMATITQSAFKTARQGLLQGLAYTPKMAWYAMANVAAIFRDGVKVADAFLCVRRPNAPYAEWQDPSIVTLCFAKKRTPYYLYYKPACLESFWEGVDDAVVDTEAETHLDPMEHPVLVDMLSGCVFELTPGKTFAGLPLTDYPLILCDRSAIEVEE